MKKKLELLRVCEPLTETYANCPEVIVGGMDAEAHADRECFWVLHFNSHMQLTDKELVAMGCINSTGVLPRELFRKVICTGADSIITVHNHPSGNLEPSKEDVSVWERVDKAGELLGIIVHDHLIISPQGAYTRKANRSWKITWAVKA